MKLSTRGFDFDSICISIIGDVLEIGVQWSVLVKDIPSFERYMAQLKCYYYDYRYTLEN